MGAGEGGTAPGVVNVTGDGDIGADVVIGAGEGRAPKVVDAGAEVVNIIVDASPAAAPRQRASDMGGLPYGASFTDLYTNWVELVIRLIPWA